MTGTERRLLTGWGGTAPTCADLVHAPADDALAAAVRGAGVRGMVARGLGRSYGDAAQNAGGIVVDMTARARLLSFDATTGIAEVEAGLSLDQLMVTLVPHGWFVPVSPGTRFVTVGGAIAADVHGKNHHLYGSFCRHVPSLDLLTADGELRTVTPEFEPDVFWATAGGMGLTGIVLRARIRMLPIETSRMRVDTERAADLDDLMARLAGADDRYDYSVSWIDLLSRGARLGRGVLTRGWHARHGDLPVKQRAQPLSYRAGRVLTAPALPSGLLNPVTVAAFNEMWFRKAPRERYDEIQSIPAFFHPLDGVRGWDRVYGRRGFVQYQFLVPFGAEGVLRQAVELIASSGHASFLAVLKRFGPGDEGPLSFPSHGWTLALDLPATWSLAPLLDQLDEMVAAAGGRVYLAKDSRLRPELLVQMYPRLPEFLVMRAKLDPSRTFISDLARRLSL